MVCILAVNKAINFLFSAANIKERRTPPAAFKSEKKKPPQAQLGKENIEFLPKYNLGRRVNVNSNRIFSYLLLRLNSFEHQIFQQQNSIRLALKMLAVSVQYVYF